MITEAVHFTAPDGRDLVVMTRELYEELSTLASTATSKRLKAVADAIPNAVIGMIERGDAPLAAWRKFRGITQTELAKLSGVHRVTIVRMEAAGFGAGQRQTRQQLAHALGVAVSAI